MWNGAQVIFDFVHVARVETPVVVPEFVQTRQRVTFDSSRHVDVWIKVAPDQIAQTSKAWFASLQTDVARARNRSPLTVILKNENYMIEQIDRFQVKQQ